MFYALIHKNVMFRQLQVYVQIIEENVFTVLETWAPKNTMRFFFFNFTVSYVFSYIASLSEYKYGEIKNYFCCEKKPILPHLA